MPNLYFKTLDDFISDVNDYANVLNTPVIDANGDSKIQLIGIDGKPTDDDSVLGSRQKIFYHFGELHKAYVAQADNPTIEDFHKAHTMALITESASYRGCVEGFDCTEEEMKKKFKEIDEIKKSVMSGGLSTIQLFEDETKAKIIIEQQYDLAFKMKAFYERAWSKAVSARLMNMVMGYTEKGREFFNDFSYFEDTFTPYLEGMFREFKDFHAKLKHNVRCESVKDMITVIN